MALRHAVMFRFHDHVDESTIARACEALQSLASHPAVETFELHRSLDERKGVVVLEDATFASAEDYQVWRVSEPHVAAGQLMAGLCDWWVVDHLTTPS